MEFKIPFVNLKRMHSELFDEIMKVFQDITGKSAFIEGEYLNKFERNFAEFCESKFCIGVSSGTDALFLALKALNIRQGDIVVTVPNTFIATAEAIIMTGADVDFVDVEEETYNMDAVKLKNYLKTIDSEKRKKIKAIIPVALYGQAPDFENILEIAKEFNLRVIVDAAQAHGAQYKGKNIAKFGDMACFSFYPGKNLGAFGDAGAVVTDNEELANRIKLLRNHGRKEKYEHIISGYNCRMDALQAAILDIKLKYLNKWNENRIKSAKFYSEKLMDNPDIKIPIIKEGNKHVFHLYVIRCKKRNNIMEKLGKEKIGFGIHYPIPLHLQEAFSYLSLKKGSYPVSEMLSGEILSLPIDGTIKKEEINFISETINT